MEPLDQRRAEYAEALECALRDIVSRLARKPEVERVILSGSYAAGRRDLFTDLDLLVVMSSEQDFVHRTAELYQQVAAGVDLDLLVYTPEEFERQRQRGFVRQALKTGKVLSEKLPTNLFYDKMSQDKIVRKGGEEMLKRFSTNFALFSLVLDLSLTAGALALAEHLRGVLLWGKVFVTDAYIPWVLYVLVVVIWLAVFIALSIYDPKRTYKAVDEFQAVLVANSFALLIFAGTLYLTFREVSRLLFIYFAVLDMGALLAWRAIARIAFRLFNNGHSLPERRVVVVGAGDLGHRIAATIREYSWMGLTLVGYLDDDPRKRDNGLPLLGTLNDAPKVVREHDVEEMVIALPQRAHEQLNRLIADLQNVPVNIRVVPDYFSLALFRATVEDFGGLPLINLREPALNPYQRLVKRALDLILGSAALVVALPVMGIIALAIKLGSPGPAVFKQQRVGEKGKLFWMLKFRSMVCDAEACLDEIVERTGEGRIIHKKRDDPRVTRVGRFIRATSLDELPQLFNVLKGEMSLIGPRPELPWLVEQYEPWQRKRFAVPQGITGWWQVNGRSDKLMHEHTEEDLYYIQNYSLLLDLQILWKTIGAVFKRSGAY